MLRGDRACVQFFLSFFLFSPYIYGGLASVMGFCFFKVGFFGYGYGRVGWSDVGVRCKVLVGRIELRLERRGESDFGCQWHISDLDYLSMTLSLVRSD